MKILHTSDWHLGRKIATHDMHEHQENALDFLVEKAIEHQVAAVLVSGDVFDGPVPNVDSMRILNKVLTRLHEAGIISILTAGNHDQADRLALNSNLMLDRVHIVGSSNVLDYLVEIEDEHGPVVIYPVTFLWPDDERHKLAKGEEPLPRTHLAVTSAVVETIKSDLAERKTVNSNVRAVVMAHSFVTKGGHSPAETATAEVCCDSERDLSIGGVQTIPSDLFDGIDYVALGHLHRPQIVNTTEHSKALIRYSGSLLRYSLSEVNHEKSFVIVDLGHPDKKIDIELVPIPQGRAMARLRDTLENLLSDKYAKHRKDFVELITTDKERPDHLFDRLKNTFEAILSHHHIPEGQDVVGIKDAKVVDLSKREPLDILSDFVMRVTGFAASDDERQVLRVALEKSEESGAK